MQYLPAIATAVIGGGSFGWLWRWIAKQFDQVRAELKECESREDDARDRRAKMWRVIDMLLDVIEDIEPQHRRLPRVRELLTDLRETDGVAKLPAVMEPAE